MIAQLFEVIVVFVYVVQEQALAAAAAVCAFVVVRDLALLDLL